MASVRKQESLSSRLKKLTKQDLNKRDVFGRTIIHIICIVGRFDLLKHLLKNPHLNSTITDHESGWTGLHYSIYYGRLSCARLLLDHNYDLVRMKDRSGLTAMDIYHLRYSYRDLKIFPESIGENDTNYSQRLKEGDDATKNHDDKLIWWDKDKRGGSEVYTFGTNVNSQLGTGDSVDKTLIPYKIQIKNFRLSDTSLSIADRLVTPRVKDIKLSKNHSIILTNEERSNVLIAGNPSRGRLGNGSLLPNFRFDHMDFFEDEHVIDVALSDDHTLALTSDGQIYSWGLNNFYELGYATEKIKEKTDTFSDEPKRVLGAVKKLKVQGISCSKIHSCAYAGDALVLWGLNVGQMDFISTGETVKHGKLKGIPQIPRQVRFNSNIKQVIATEEATIVLLVNDECHILTNGNHLRFQLPLYKTLNNEFEYFRPSGFSKRKQIIKLVSKDSTKIGILYDDGSVMNFGVDMFSKASNIKYTSVWAPRNDHLKCTDVDIGKDGSIIICSKSGNVYKRIARNGSNDFKFTKIERTSKIVKVSCDSLFSSFGFIKDDVDQLPMNIYKNKFLKDIAYLSPLSQSDANRKQLELVNPYLCDDYVVNFLHKPSIEIDNDDEYHRLFRKQLNIDDDENDEIAQDPILKAYRERWGFVQPLRSTFNELDQSKYVELLSSEDLNFGLNSFDFSTGKGYDLLFDIDGCSIGVHSSVLFFIKNFNNIADSDLKFDNFIFHRVDECVIKVEGLHLHSVLIMLHLLYTGVILKPWDVLQSPLFQEIRVEVDSLLKHLELLDDLKRPVYEFTSKFRKLDNFENDITILLKDNETIECCSYILRARNAYFETFFSERWDESNVLEFEHVNKEIFQVALDYIYGHEQLSLFDSFFHLTNIIDFINVIFELIELSDELLLFGLKDFGQLMIKDFIKQDNVLLILHHAENLNCRKLIGECLWFIYNNVEPFLTDQDYEDLVSQEMVKKIDSYCRWLNRVNKVHAEDAKSSWYDGNSTDLVNTFLSEIRDFNDIFLESDNFVPLFDIPPKKEYISSKAEQKKNKLPSPSPSPSLVVMDRKKSVSASSTPYINTNGSASRKSSFSDSSAIEFTDDDFQPVINSRRRKSSSNRLGSNGNSLQTPALTTPALTTPIKSSNGFTPVRSHPVPINTPPSSLYQHRNQSIDIISRNSWSGHNSPPASLTPLPNWATPGNGSSSNSSGTSPLFSNKWSSSPPTKTSSPFGATSRLSQKERRRMMKQNEDILKVGVEKSKENTPWKIPSANSSTSALKSPSLAAAREEEIAAESDISIPSLKGIIHEEEHKIYEFKVKETQRKSLAEVQQEEEFARWWEEESRKVQTELNVWNSGNVLGDLNGHRQPNANTNGKKASKKKKITNTNDRLRKKSVP